MYVINSNVSYIVISINGGIQFAPFNYASFNDDYVKFAWNGNLFTHLGFHECPCHLELTFILYFVDVHVYGLNDSRLTNDGWLLPSLYLNTIILMY